MNECILACNLSGMNRFSRSLSFFSRALIFRVSFDFNLLFATCKIVSSNFLVYQVPYEFEGSNLVHWMHHEPMYSHHGSKTRNKDVKMSCTAGSYGGRIWNILEFQIFPTYYVVTYVQATPPTRFSLGCSSLFQDQSI